MIASQTRRLTNPHAKVRNGSSYKQLSKLEVGKSKVDDTKTAKNVNVMREEKNC